MEQYMYVQLDGGQVVQVSDSVVDGSYEVRSDHNTRTFVVQEELNMGGTGASSQGSSGIHDTRDVSDQVFYIVQQEGSNLDGMQFAVVGENTSSDSQPNVHASSHSGGTEVTDANILTIPPLNNNIGTETTSRIASDNHSGTADLGFQETSSNTVIIATENQGTESVELSFHCQFCGDVFLLQDWQQHLQEEHGHTEMEGVLGNSEVVTLLPTCSLCSKTFLNEEELNIHKKEHSTDVGIVRMMMPGTKAEDKEHNHHCKICYKTFNEKHELKKHVRESHPNKFTQSSDKSSMFAKCPYCHKMFIQRGNNKALINHIYSSHPGKDVDCLFKEPVDEKIKCIFCGLEFVWTKSVIRHMKASHPTEFLEQEDLILSSLNLMDAKTSTKRHRRSVKDLDENDSVLFRCKHCPRQFLWEKTLKRHVQEIHDNLEESLDKKPARKKSQGAVVYCCPFCDLVSKYACAVRKHVERKHPEKVEGINVNKMEVPTMEADNVANKLKTVDKRPLELRSDFFPVIFRCPFCSYASNQGSNLIRHLTSIKHGNIFSADEIRQIKVSSFKVRQKLGGDLMKVDGTPQRSLPKLRLKGHVLSLVLKKYEILKQTKKEEKENENNEKGDEQYYEMDIENIIDMAENESDESFDEQEDEEFEMKQPRSTRTNSAHVNKKVGQNLQDRTDDKVKGKRNEDSLDEEIEETNMDAEAETLELNEDIDDEDEEPSIDNSEQSMENQQIHTLDDKLNRMCRKEAGMQSDRKVHSDQRNLTEGSLIDESYVMGSNSEQSETRQEHGSKKLSDKEPTLICIGCKKEFAHFDEFKSHLSTHVNLKVEFTCTDCGDKFPLWKDFKIHAENEHDMSYTSPGIESVTLNVVKMNSKPITTFDCPYCEMLFSQSSPLEQHIIIDHSDFIQSTTIKQEPGTTQRRKSGITAISGLNCQFCECFYTSVTDIVKHMFVIHKDVDKSALLKVDNSGVRKSGRKRKAPKWLEEESQTESKSKLSKSVRVVENEIKTSKKSSETANSRHLKEGQKENLKCSTVNTRKQTKEISVEACSPKNATNFRDEDSTVITSPKRSEKAIQQKPTMSKAQENLTCRNENSGSVDPSFDINKCPHCDFVAKRSSALAFHINFKHSNIKMKQELSESADKSVKKISDLDLQPNRKGLFKNKIQKDSEPEGASVKGESENSKLGESDPADDGIGEKNIPDKAIRILNDANEESPVTEIGNESEMLDEAAEFGDSDDDFRPGSDDDEEDDGDSDLDDLTDEDNEGFSLSVMLDCPYCTTGNFDVFNNLEEHVKLNHPEKADSFSIAALNTRIALDGTLKTPNMIHTCNYCKKMFFGKSKLRAHVKNSHQKKSATDLQHKNKARNRKIKKVSELEEFYKCPFCTVLTHLHEDIQLHARQHHGQEIGSIEKYKFQEKETVETTYKCPFCETRSMWKNCLLRHVSRAHSDQVDFGPDQVGKEIVLVESKDNKGTLFQCVYCSWQCERKREVLNHINDVHLSEPEVSLEDIVAVDSAVDMEDCFQCPYCELTSKYKRCVIRHVSRSHKDKKGFTKHDVIVLSRKHGKNIDRRQGRLFRCLYCPAESPWKSCVVQHIQKEHPDGNDRNIAEYHVQEGANVDLDNMLFNTNDSDFKYYRCSYCEVVSESRKGIVAHASDVHVQEPMLQCVDVQEVDWNRAENIREEYVFQCPISQCHSTSKSRKRVIQHVRAAHPTISTFTIPVILKSGPQCQSSLLCKLCNELCHSEVEIAMHARDVHGNEEHVVLETISKVTKLTNIFSCPYCEHTSNLRKAIIKHVEVYHADKSNFQASDVRCEVIRAIDDEEKTGGFQCPYCDTVNHWKKSIIRHMKTVHPAMPCNIDIEFNPNVNIKNNSKSARKSSKQINCLRCGTTCRSMEKMKKHFEAKHPMFAKNFLSKENTEFAYNSLNTQPLENVCVLCNARYMWKKSLLVHIKRRHKDVYDVYQVLDEVLDTISANTDVVPDQTKLQPCTLTEQTNSSPQVYKKPVFNAQDKSLVQCRKCNKTFKTSWALKVHSKITHLYKRQNRFPCGKCGITFPTKTLHRQHKARFHLLQNPAMLQCSVAGCDYRCRFSHKLRNHYKNVHSIQKPTIWKLSQRSELQDEIRCEICSRTFTSTRVFAQHVLVHKKRGKFRIACNFCGKQFQNRVQRDFHIENDHKDKIEMCDICGALCAKSKLQQHIKTHDDVHSTRVECPYCHKSVNERLLNRHAMMYHTDILNCGCVICTSTDNEFIDSGFYCATCGDTFCQKLMLDIHTKLQHDVVRSTTSKYYFCELCPDVYFATKHMKNVHCHEHHRRKILPPQPVATPSVNNEAGDGGDEMTHVIHIGQDEGKQFLPKLSEASMNAVIKELLVVERGAQNPYKCLLCNRSFSKSKYIKLHIRRAHVKDEDQPYRCKLCGSGFVRLTEFRKHSRAHSDFRPYKCRYCDRAFKQQANLRDHYRIHTMNKDYECYICKTEFRQRGGLTSHVVFHDTLKPFKCMFCEKGFTTRGELSRHMQKYNKDMGDQSAEKMYPCHLCDKTYTHYPVLLKHIETHNPEKPFKCSACEEKFANYVAMYFHKVREEHFLLEEIQQGLKDLQKKGRKFRAKKHSQGQMVPQIILESNQATETIYVSQAGASEVNEANVKPVEVIIEEFGREQQVVRVQENEPEHEELLSIAKQLTELSGFTEGEYYTSKKTNHQEEDEIIKTMLDADEEVLANLSKQSVARLHLTEYEKFVAKEEGMEEVHNVQNGQQHDDFDNMPDVENDGEIEDEHVNNNGLHVTEANSVAPIRTLPTNMEELVNLVAQTSSSDSSEQIVAIQNEDGSVIYVCLKDDANKTEVISDNTMEAYDETIQNPDILDQEVENTEDAEMEVETNEEIVEDGEKEDNFIDNTNQETENQTEEFIPQQNMELPTDAPIFEQIRQQETKIETPHVTVQSLFSNTADQQNLFSVASVMHNLVKTDASMVQGVEMHEIQLETNHLINNRNTPETMITGHEHVTGNNSQITSISGTTSAEESHIATTIKNLDYNVEEPMCDKIVIPPHTQQDTVVESQEELIKRSQLAQHLTGKIQPFTEPRKVHTRAVVTRQGLKVLDMECEPVTTSTDRTDNISQTMVTIAAAAASRMQDISDNKPGPSSSGSIDPNQVAFASQDGSYVGEEDSVEEYHDDESTFIKEELLNEDYTGANDKGREIMFVSDNIYTYSETENKFICLHCGTKVRTFKNLKSHIRRHAPETSRFHKCTYCTKRFVTKNELKRHLWIHTGERNYACKTCGKKFIQPGHLQEHERVHTGFKPFSCSQCNTAFNTKSQLVLHWTRKHSDNEIACNQCDKTFKNHVDLKRHQGMEHSSLKTRSKTKLEDEGGDHVCEICGQSFGKIATLKRHLEKHNLEDSESQQEDTRYMCEECGVSFKSKYYVKEHMKSKHSEERNEACPDCTMMFKTRIELRKHRETIHKEKESRWQCKHCDKAFSTKYALGYHMGAKHMGETNEGIQ